MKIRELIYLDRRNEEEVIERVLSPADLLFSR